MEVSYSNNEIANWRNYVSGQRIQWLEEIERLESINKNSEEYYTAQKSHDYFLGAERQFMKSLDFNLPIQYEEDYVIEWSFFYYGCLQAANHILGISEFDGQYNFEYISE